MFEVRERTFSKSSRAEEWRCIAVAPFSREDNLREIDLLTRIFNFYIQTSIINVPSILLQLHETVLKTAEGSLY